MIKLGALWKRQGKKGPFLAGKLGDASIMIFPNDQKSQPNQPDYAIFVAEDRKPEGQQRPAPQQQAQPQRPQAKNFAPVNNGSDPEDIGF